MPELSPDLTEMLALLKKLVETESPSTDKAAVDRVGAIVAGEARRLGATVETLPSASAGDQVLARWGQGSGGILLLCHMDTVFPLGTLQKTPFRQVGDKTFGPGTLDMKAGIVISLAAIELLQKNDQMPKRPITLLCTSDEETGSDTSREHIERLAKESALVLVLESALLDGSLKTWRKGVGDFEVRVTGRAAHSGGEHEKGRNAIEELSHQVIAIQKLTDYAKGTTVNIGTIHGGIATNVVPDEAVAMGDMRVLDPAEASRIMAALKALKPVLDGTTITVSGGLNRPPMPFDATMEATFARAREIGETLGLNLKAGGSGGGSDANFVAPLGIPVLDGLGAIGEGYHSEREFLFTESLPERARLLAALLRDW
jgi:glutamate carboxypeptidase